MKNIFETKVYYSDTDAYGVVWHGAYLRWLEKGRADLCNTLGLDLVSMKISNAGKLYRRMPADLIECFEKAVKDDEKSLVTC